MLRYTREQDKPNRILPLTSLMVVIHQTLSTLGNAPARHLQVGRERLAELEVQAADIPLFITTAPSDQSFAPKMELNRKHSIAARKSATA